MDEQLVRALDRAAHSMGDLASQQSYSQQSMLELRLAVQETNELLRDTIAHLTARKDTGEGSER